jgi:2-polyprenyl-3-methyl-5-hydroxy-6-metoxy-1,4-benzoquinol methylase
MACPLCSSTNIKRTATIETEPLIDRWMSDFQVNVREEFQGVSSIDLLTCNVCKLQYFTPAEVAGSPAVYEALEKFEWYYMPRKWEYDVALDDLRGLQRVLEIGCGAGDFMILARDEVGVEIEGLEQNSRAIQKASHRGLRVREATIEDVAAQSPANYDAVCSFQVLEHVRKPGEFLKACCDLLRPGGKLLFGVPNADSFIRYEFNPLDMPPHHMSRWSSEVLSNLPRLFPLRAKHIRLEPLAEYHVDSYLAAYCAHFARGPLKLLNRPGIRGRIARLLRLGLRRRLRGHTVYACYERV